MPLQASAWATSGPDAIEPTFDTQCAAIATVIKEECLAPRLSEGQVDEVARVVNVAVFGDLPWDPELAQVTNAVELPGQCGD